MTDLDILTLGCAISFIAAGGAYVFLRERFLERERSPKKVAVPVPKTDRTA